MGETEYFFNCTKHRNVWCHCYVKIMYSEAMSECPATVSQLVEYLRLTTSVVSLVVLHASGLDYLMSNQLSI